MTSNGRVVLTAMPDQVKTDFNDLLQKQGCHKVESLLNDAKPYQNFVNLSLSNASKKEIISESIKSLQEPKVSQPKIEKPKTIQRSVPEVEIDF